MCTLSDAYEVEYALQNISSPIGVSEFNVRELLPENMRSKLPTVEEVENELNAIASKID